MGNLTFSTFKQAVQKQFAEISKHDLFKTDVTKDELWDFYLNSFPEGTNPLYKERREYDCQSCKHFIRACGNVVTIIDNKIVTIWDTTTEGYYQEVADKMAEFVKSFSVRDVFYSSESNLGSDFNRQTLEDGTVVKWEHFFFKLPKSFIKNEVATILGDHRSSKDVFKRSLEEITTEAAEMVIELIDQNSIYRGEENRVAVDFFLKHKKAYDKLPDREKDLYCWAESKKAGHVSRIRNTAIGTLLVDLSNGMELDQAVRSFETKVAPMNYKRPTALITKGMIKKAEQKVEELGIADSLPRRYAVPEDITINNVLFANREAKKAMSVFDELAAETKEDVKKFDHVESVDIETFVKNILPKAESIELMLENKHINNLMSLVAPVNPDAKGIFKWENNFSWAYNGDVTDSIKERVKKAGGNVNGVFRCSLSWFNYDDLDIHMIEPGENHIYFRNAKFRHPSSGMLDVDMNAGGGYTREGVENIIYTNLSQMPEGEYQLFINQYDLRERVDNGFDCEVEFDDKIYSFHYDKVMKTGENIMVAKIKFSREEGFHVQPALPSTQSSREVWGLTTNHFQKVSMVMYSPNHWDEGKVGNRHYFFILEGCKNDGSPRGFFNEFLSNELIEHRKVFEVLGSKMKVEESDNQLSGVGFSSTMRNEIICKVSGSFSRSIKITF